MASCRGLEKTLLVLGQLGDGRSATEISHQKTDSDVATTRAERTDERSVPRTAKRMALRGDQAIWFGRKGKDRSSNLSTNEERKLARVCIPEQAEAHIFLLWLQEKLENRE
jgi:hypothetical protein